MRILHVFKTYMPDGITGIERMIWEIAEGAAKQGVESDVFYLSDRDRDHVALGAHHIHTVKTHLALASTPINFTAWSRFRKLAKRADLIHYHYPWPMMDLLHFLAGGHRRPSIVTYHSDIVKQAGLLRLYQPLMRRFLGSVDRIVATSPRYLETSPILQRYVDKSQVIDLGIDQSRFDEEFAQRDGTRFKDLPKRYFLFLGALRYYKGLDFLIEAARITGLPVVIAGRGELSPSAMSNLPGNVHLAGPVSDAEKSWLLANAGAFAFPSHLRSEAFGVALVEAAFAAKPMISCEIGTGTSYVNLDGVTGLVAKPANSASFAEVMQKLWNDEEMAQRFGQAARERALQLFSAERMVNAYLDLYRELAPQS